ncbi:hypothetical protein E4T66_17695 [Sinimarinibacterium sp. CAU 1509]|nr:hypothetical protein E4T66_17695 [Sinimarinibacterium sp. CAU 1509]
MQSKSVNAGPNGSHVVIASRSGLRYWGDLKPLQPLPGTVAIQPATNIDVLMADFVLHPPTQPTYFVQLEQAYREVVRSCRPTISARAVHLNGGKPLCVDARAIRAVLTAFGDAMPESRELAPLAAARVQLGKGPLAGDPFTHAKAVLASWHLRYPALADLFPERSAWLIEPSSDSWPVLATCLRQIQRGGVSL